jgi:hypothetical protein
MAASRYDRDEFRRLDVKLIFGAVVKLEVLPQGVRADSLHGPHGLNSAYKKSLREIADFKAPMHAPGLYPEHDIFIQLMKLKNTLRWMRGEDLITHLGQEYYD